MPTARTTFILPPTQQQQHLLIGLYQATVYLFIHLTLFPVRWVNFNLKELRISYLLHHLFFWWSNLIFFWSNCLTSLAVGSTILFPFLELISAITLFNSFPSLLRFFIFDYASLCRLRLSIQIRSCSFSRIYFGLHLLRHQYLVFLSTLLVYISKFQDVLS